MIKTRQGQQRELLVTEDAAAYLSVTASVLRSWRVRGCGPRYFKLGSAVRYDRRALDEWLDAQVVE